MTVLRFFSDPHVGKELKANTTPASRATLAEQIFLHGLQAAEMPHPQGKEVHATICGGDLFDTDTNPEHVLLKGDKVARKCNLVLGGNHDVINIAGRESTLSALAQLTEDERFVMPPAPGRTHFHFQLMQTDAGHLGDIALYVIPHHARQQEFEKVLDEALADAKKFDGKPVRRLLLVHCNYHLTFEAGENDLNLTDAKARYLLQTFDYIVMGHDHRPRRECEGRLIVLGNTHVTGFSDLGEKLVWFYDSETNDWVTEQNAAPADWKINAADLIEAERNGTLGELGSAEWVDLVGELPPEAAVDLAKAVRALWRVSPYIYAIRASKVLFRAEGQTDEVAPAAAQKTLIEIIEEQLSASPDLLELFREAKDLKE